MVGSVRGLRELVVEGDRLRGGRLVGGQHLGVVHAGLVADDELPDGGSTHIRHLLDARLVHDGGPLFASLDLEAGEHDSSVVGRGLKNLFVVGQEIFLQLHEVRLLAVSRAENQRERFAHLGLLIFVGADLH